MVRLSLVSTVGRAIVFGSLAVSLACTRPAGRQQVLDLYRLVDTFEQRRQIDGLAIGDPSSSGDLLGGFYSIEGTPSGKPPPFRWSRGNESVLDLYLAQPQDFRLVLECSPYVPASGSTREQSVTVILNGTELGHVTLLPDWHQYSVDVPLETTQAGSNRLVLRYAWSTEPGSQGGRRLAVAWRRVIFDGIEAARPPRSVIRDRPGLELDQGSELSLYLEGDQDFGSTSRSLVVTELRAQGAPTHLQVAIDDEKGSTLLAQTSAQQSPWKLDLPRVPPGAVRRLTLRAAGLDGGSLWLQQPKIISRIDRRKVRSPERAPASLANPRPPHVVLFLVDTLRRDRLGVYGNTRGLTSRTDRFATESILFEEAVAQSSWTKPSVASVLTGLDPLHHGTSAVDSRLPESFELLSERLQRAGYETAAVSSNRHIDARSGFAQGFDDFYFEGIVSAERVIDRAFDWLDRRTRARPFFLYLHLIDPHAPYEPPQAERERFAATVSDPSVGSRQGLLSLYRRRPRSRSAEIEDIQLLYDAEVAAMDSQFGRLLDGLAQRGIYDNTLLIFLSDHGEEFDEHGFLGHGRNLFAQSLAIPLIIKPSMSSASPIPPGTRIQGPAQHLDIITTVLSAATLPTAGLPGIDLLADERLPADREAYSYLDYEGRVGMALSTGEWKQIVSLSRRFRGPGLFRPRSDPGEIHELSAIKPHRAGLLSWKLRRWLAQSRPGIAATIELDSEAQEELRALGYL